MNIDRTAIKKSEFNRAATESTSQSWASVYAQLLAMEQAQPERRIVRVLTSAPVLPSMFIGVFANAPIELIEAGKPTALQWHDGEIVVL